jgi:hypothetical protein
MRMLLGTLAAALLGATATLVMRPEPAGAQDATRFLYIPGMRIDRDKPIATVRLHNATDQVVILHYTVIGPDTGAALSLPNAGISGIALLGGDEIELDLGRIVTQYRASQGVGPFTGRVTFTANGDASGGALFRPESIDVTATQVEGRTKYQANIEWR